LSVSHHSLELTGVAGDPTSAAHRLDPRAKVIGLTAATVVAVSAPLALWPVYVVCAAVPVSVAVAGRVPPAAIWKRARWVLPLVIAVALLVPLVRDGGAAYALGPLTVHQQGLEVLAMVAAKATIGILAAVVLATTTSFPDVLRALEAMRLPRVMVLIASLMYRYLFVIVEEVGRMRAALVARAYRPRSALRAGALGRVASALFLRTYERGERVHLAMLARGYRGRMPELEPLRFGGGDAAFVLAIVVALVGARIA